MIQPLTIFLLLFFFFLQVIRVFLKKYFCFYLFIFGCIGSPLLRVGFLQLGRAGATLRRGARASHCGGFSCWGARALGAWASVQDVGSVVVAHRLQSAGSVVVAHGLSCSTACGILLYRGSNPCPLHCQADSLPLRHQGSPNQSFLYF